MIQYTYVNDGTDDNDHWYFEKLDTLGVNEAKTCYIGKNSMNYFYLSDYNNDSGDYCLYQQANYIVETVGYQDTILYLDDSQGNVQYNDDQFGSTNALISFPILYSESVRPFLAKVKLYGNAVGNCTIRLRPVKEVYFNSYTNNTSGDKLDTTSDVYNTVSILNEKFIYVNQINNTSHSYMNGTAFSGNRRYNNEYYFIASHGSENGAISLSPTQSISPSSLPDMTNVKFAVFAICFGGKAGNAADYAVKYKNATSSVGWPGTIGDASARTFTDKLWELIKDGKSVASAVAEARTHTKNTYFWLNVTGWGDNTILDPRTYFKSGVTMSASAATDKVSLSSFADDCWHEITASTFNTFLTNNAYSIVQDQDDAHVRYVVKTINGLLTNEIYVIENRDGNVTYRTNKVSATDTALANANSKQAISVFAQNENTLNYTIGASNRFYLQTKNGIRLVQRQQVIFSDPNNVKYLEERFWDEVTGEALSFDYVDACFKGVL